MASTTVLHITVHLGGGVGRVLSQTALYRQSSGSPVDDVFVCLEEPKTRDYADLILASGARLIIAPEPDELAALIAEADIVQVEWWHHPLIAGWLCAQDDFQARLVVWAHVSGLHYPVVPPAFTHLPHAFLFTSAASLHGLPEDDRPRRNILDVVSSTGGFDDLPISSREEREERSKRRFGYLGSLNPAKMHPQMAEYIACVDHPEFAVDFYGDASVNPEMQSTAAGSTRIRLHGYTDRPGAALRDMDVLVYLLNPTHYGTTENALLEAMACGVVPIVLDNLVESSIVQHGETGLVVDSPQSFAEAVAYLTNNPEEQLRLSSACSAAVRERYSVPKTIAEMDRIYASVLAEPKKRFDFRAVFGDTPSEWFLSCAGRYASCFAPGNEAGGRVERRPLRFLYEKSKSSVFHFLQYFPEDERLSHWAVMLEKDYADLR